MALTDPIVQAGTYIGGATFNKSFARISEGLYQDVSTTPDEPVFLIVKNTLNLGGTSRYILEYRRQKNVSVSGVIQPDDTLRVYLNLQVPHRSFTTQDCLNGMTHVEYLFNTITKGDQILRGEK